MDKAYNEQYVSAAQKTLAVYVDYAVNYEKIPLETTMNKFISSGVARAFQQGHPSYTVGCSGLELYCAVNYGETVAFKEYKPYWRSAEYWFGYVLAFYQWYSNKSFEHILNAISANRIIAFYAIFHEMDIMQFVDRMDKELANYSNIERLRTMQGLSQQKLAEKSSVNVRTIRDYEAYPQKILKAQYNNLFNLSTTLNCSVDDLIYSENNDLFSYSNAKSAYNQLKSELEQLEINHQIKLHQNGVFGNPKWQYGSLNNLQLQKFNNNIVVNKKQFENNWNNYWYKNVQEKHNIQLTHKQQDSIHNLAKMAIAAAVEKASPTAGAIFEGFNILTAKNLYEAVLDAISLTDNIIKIVEEK
ncbi:MAG: helix-turn-helix transcriptional regulator [Bacillota bacterium]